MGLSGMGQVLTVLKFIDLIPEVGGSHINAIDVIPRYGHDHINLVWKN